MTKKILPVIFLTFINTLGFAILIPVLPFVVKNYNASSIVYGFLLSIYFIFQFLGAPFLGALSDHYGRKPILMLSHFGTLISWGIFGLAYFVPGVSLFGIALPLYVIGFARIVDGITGGNMSVANAYLSDITTPPEKARAFGTIGAVLGLGMIIGPTLGSFSSATRFGYFGTAVVAFLISLLTLICMQRYLKESLAPQHRVAVVVSNWLSHLNIWRKIRKYREKVLVMNILQLRIFFALAMTAYTSVIVFYIIDVFGLSEKELGVFLLFVGTFVIFNQGVLVKKFVQFFGDKKTLVLGQLFMMVGLLTIHLTTKLWLFILLYYTLNLGLSLSLPSFKALITNNVSRSEQGEIMGIDEALNSFASIFAPTIAGILYFQVGGYAFSIFAGFLVCSLLLLYLRTKKFGL